MRQHCTPENAHLFDPAATPAEHDKARELCEFCPLAEACRSEAARLDGWGIWGGEFWSNGRRTKSPQSDQLTYTADQRREAHRLRQRGDTSPWVLEADRQYYRGLRLARRAKAEEEAA